MTKSRMPLLLVIVGLVVSGVSVSCGGGDEVADAPAPTPTEQPMKVAEREAAPPPVVTPDERREPVTQEAAAGELRQKVELPDYYPSDAPVYPGTEPSQVSQSAKGRVTAMFGTDDSPQQVLQYMHGYLPDAGWSVIGQHELPGGQLLQATKGERLVSVLLSRVEEGREDAITMIAISVDS